jgi:tetratricopeptide (TPR) repeat protein
LLSGTPGCGRNTKVLTAEAAAAGKPQFPLWDFSGFNSVTTEAVPPAGDTTTVMKGFWHESHYKKEVGDLMIDRMFNYSDPARAVPPDFGKLLTPSRIDRWLAETRAQMRAYMASQPTEAALVESVVDSVMVDAEGANCGDDVRVLREASAAQSRGNFAAAAADFARAIRIGPPNTALHYLRGAALLHAEEFPAAAKEFESGLQLEPANKILAQLLQQARSAKKPNNPSEARQH